MMNSEINKFVKKKRNSLIVIVLLVALAFGFTLPSYLFEPYAYPSVKVNLGNGYQENQFEAENQERHVNEQDKHKDHNLETLVHYRKIIKRILTEVQEVQAFAHYVSFHPNSNKSKEMIEDYAKNLFPLNDLVDNIRTLNDAIQGRSKEELEKLHRIAQNRIKELQNPQKCKYARKLVCRVLPRCGLGCTFHHIAICMFISLGTDRTMIIDFEKSSAYKGTRDVFQPLSETCLKAKLSNAVEWEGEFLQKTHNDTTVVTVTIKDARFRDTQFAPFTIPQSLKEKLLSHHDDPNNWWIGQIMEYLTRLQPWVLDKIEDVKRSINLIHPYVGIHVRRTDKIKEANYHEIEEYMMHVDDWYNREKKSKNASVIRKVYIASDEKSVFGEAVKKFPKYKFYQNPNAQNISSMNRMSKEGLVLMVCDLMILSQSNYFVGTFTSNIGRLIHQLMQAKQDATFMIRSIDAHPYFHGSRQYHEAIEDHVAAQGEISLNIGDRIYYKPIKCKGDLAYKGCGRNLRTKERGIYPLYKVKEKILTASYPGFDEASNL